MIHSTYVIALSPQAKWYVVIRFKYLIPITCLNLKTDKRGLGKFNDGKDFDEECFGQSNLDGNYKKSQSQRQCCGVYPNRWENTHPVHFRSSLSVAKFESRLNLRYFKATKIWKFGPVRIFFLKRIGENATFWLADRNPMNPKISKSPIKIQVN